MVNVTQLGLKFELAGEFQLSEFELLGFYCNLKDLTFSFIVTKPKEIQN